MQSIGICVGIFVGSFTLAFFAFAFAFPALFAFFTFSFTLLTITFLSACAAFSLFVLASGSFCLAFRRTFVMGQLALMWPFSPHWKHGRSDEGTCGFGQSAVR